MNYYDPYGYGYQRFDPSAYNPWVRNQQRQRLNSLEQQQQQYLNNPDYVNMQQYNNQQQVNSGQQYTLRGRPVSNYDEANAYIIDLDGSIFYFPNISNGEIYTKQIGMDGTSIIKTYKLTQPQQSQNQNQNNNFDFSAFMNNQNNNENNQIQTAQNNTLIDPNQINENSEQVKQLNQKVKNLENYVNSLEMEIRRYVESNSNVNGYDGQQSAGTGYVTSVSTNTELAKPTTDYAVDVWQQSDNAESYAENAR